MMRLKNIFSHWTKDAEIRNTVVFEAFAFEIKRCPCNKKKEYVWKQNLFSLCKELTRPLHQFRAPIRMNHTAYNSASEMFCDTWMWPSDLHWMSWPPVWHLGQKLDFKLGVDREFHGSYSWVAGTIYLIRRILPLFLVQRAAIWLFVIQE